MSDQTRHNPLSLKGPQMVSVSNTPPATRTPTAAPAAKPAATKAPIKPPLTKSPAATVKKDAAPAQEAKAVKAPKPERVIEKDATTGLSRNQPHSFRWVCLDALKETWPDSGKQEDFIIADCITVCRRMYEERGGKKEFTDEVWTDQINTIRAWLRSKGVNKPLPGDLGSARTPMTDEQKAKLKERLAAGRAKKQALKGPLASVDAQDEAAAEVEEE